MASNRDRLRAMSQRNSETQKRATEHPTLVTNLSNQLNSGTVEILEQPIEKTEDIPEQDNTQQKDASAETNTDTAVVQMENTQKESDSVVTKMLEHPIEKTEDMPEQDNTQKDAGAEANTGTAVVRMEKENRAPKSHAKKYTKSIKEKYKGQEVAIPLLLSEEVDEYLRYRSIELRMPAKEYFIRLMTEEIENCIVVEDDLVKAYRKGQHKSIRRSMNISAELKEDIINAAIKYHMRYTAFMAYVIDKARLAEAERKK